MLHTYILYIITDAEEKEAKVKESVERAKQAVALDVKDGTSWSMLFTPLSRVVCTSQQTLASQPLLISPLACGDDMTISQCS